MWIVLLWNKLMDLLQTPFLLVIRLYWGIQFAQAGWGKLTNLERVTGFFTELGIPFPELNAAMAGGIEFLGGILLVIGLFTRIAVIPMIFTMLVAYFTAHREELFKVFSDSGEFLSAAPFSYLFAFLVILCFGPGKASVDAYLEDRANRSQK